MGESVITFRVPNEIKNEIEELAKRTNKTVSELMREVTAILAEINKSNKLKDTLLKFVDVLTDMYPDMKRKIEIDVNKKLCKEYDPTITTKRCVIRIKIDKSGKYKDLNISLIAVSLTDWEFNVWNIDIASGLHKNISAPPTTDLIDAVIEALRRLLT